MDVGKRACTVTRVGPSSPPGCFLYVQAGAHLMPQRQPFDDKHPSEPCSNKSSSYKGKSIKKGTKSLSQLTLHTPDYGWIPFLVPPPPSPPGDRLDLSSPQVPTG